MPQYLVGHEGSDGPADFVVLLLISRGTKQCKDEPGWHSHLRQVGKHDCLLESHKRHDFVGQRVDFAHENVCRLGTGRNLLQEMLIVLCLAEQNKNIKL